MDLILRQMEKIDIVYKLGTGSENGDSELRYSLRSLVNFPLLGKVYVIGHKPSWLQNVIHIPVEDCYTQNKDANLINKLILASCHKEISEEFINMSDDQVFLKEIDYREISIPYYNNKLYESATGGKVNRWQIRLERTVNALRSKNLPINCFECHIPVLLRREKFAQVLFNYDYGFDRGYVGNTLYFNSLGIQGRELDPNIIARLFNDDHVKSVERIESLCEGKIYLSYSQNTEVPTLFQFLNKRFPEKSKFEC